MQNIFSTTSPPPNPTHASHATPPRGGAGGGEHRANTAFHRIMETAPMGLLISAALGLAIVGVFQYIFYLGVLPTGWSALLRAIISTSLAAFFEALGFYFLVATVRDFSAGHRREGYIGLTATFLLWAYALWEAHHISAAFDAGGKYWAIMGIIGTIVCVVRVVELRITLTVTSAFRRHDTLAEAETTLATYRKQLDELTGKVNRYESEMKAADNRKKAESERLAALEAEAAERKQAEEYAALQKELSTLRRIAAKAESDQTGKIKISSGKVETAIRDFMRKNRGMKPSREQIASVCNVDARSLRNHFPNGSLDGIIDELFREINQAQPETSLSS